MAEARLVAQHVKPLAWDTGAIYWGVVQILVFCFTSGSPAKAPGKAAGDCPSAWAPATHLGDQGVLNFWLQFGPGLVIVAILGSKPLDARYLSLYLSNK